MNINTKLKQAKQILFTDDNVFNKDLTKFKTLKQIKEVMGIVGKPKKVGCFGNKYVYRISECYNFTLTIVS